MVCFSAFPQKNLSSRLAFPDAIIKAIWVLPSQILQCKKRGGEGGRKPLKVLCAVLTLFGKSVTPIVQGHFLLVGYMCRVI